MAQPIDEARKLFVSYVVNVREAATLEAKDRMTARDAAQVEELRKEANRARVALSREHGIELTHGFAFSAEAEQYLSGESA